MLTWEGTQNRGASDIVAQLKKPELMHVKTRIDSTDAQPGANQSVVVHVTGNLAVDNALDKPQPFARSFKAATAGR
nr:ketosteroid isomerase family protein [Streptomyces sp. SJL17-1]